MTPFSSYFHDLRRRHHVSQTDLAQLMGYKQGYISSLEIGKKTPHKEFISKLIAGLNLDAAEQAALRQAVEESQREYILPSNTSAEVAKMVNKLWREIESLNPTQIRIINEVLQLQDHCSSSSSSTR